ncbi:hypothetical protein C8P66_104218 [Humitalea rosea]|uniref:PhnA-like protein n=1 Tax=Humitalea rosea TaxID=990373 RepID=A0A2W7ISX0_9PROT|nr:hypothetical protein [Humitalea rosea]PZW48800.1 hypothetical protein C8P66_104218 [Humitalea rosea]
MQTAPSAPLYATEPASPVAILPSRVSWGAILAGTLVAITVGAMLNILGVAIGASTVDAVARDTPSAMTLSLTAGGWMLVSNLLGVAAGACVAARLSGTVDRMDAILHGLGVWATAFLVSGVLLGGAVSGGLSAGASVLSGAASGVGTAVASATSAVDPEALIERARLALTTASDPAQMTSDQRLAEVTGLIGKSIASGDIALEDRSRMTALVAAEAGIPEAEAAQRIQAYQAEARRQAQEAEEAARRAADTAAAATAITAYWIVASLLLGALAALIGAGSGVRPAMVVTDRRYA